MPTINVNAPASNCPLCGLPIEAHHSHGMYLKEGNVSLAHADCLAAKANVENGTEE